MNRSGPIDATWINLPEAEARTVDWAALVAHTGVDVWFSPVWATTWYRDFGNSRKRSLLSARHDCVSLAPISEMYALPVRLQDTIRRMRNAMAHPGTRLHMHTVIPLPDRFDAYLALTSRNRQQKYRRTKRGLEQKQHMTTWGFSGTNVSPQLGRFFYMHNRQRRQIGRLVRLANWPGSANFYVGSCRHRDGTTRVHLQESNSGDIAPALFHFAAAKSWIALVPACNMNWVVSRLEVVSRRWWKFVGGVTSGCEHHTNRRWQPPRRLRHEGRYQDVGVCATGQRWFA